MTTITCNHETIKELEAKLAKAMDALDRISVASIGYALDQDAENHTLRYAHASTRNLAFTTLAELKGE